MSCDAKRSRAIEWHGSSSTWASDSNISAAADCTSFITSGTTCMYQERLKLIHRRGAWLMTVERELIALY